MQLQLKSHLNHRPLWNGFNINRRLRCSSNMGLLLWRSVQTFKNVEQLSIAERGKIDITTMRAILMDNMTMFALENLPWNSKDIAIIEFHACLAPCNGHKKFRLNQPIDEMIDLSWVKSLAGDGSRLNTWISPVSSRISYGCSSMCRGVVSALFNDRAILIACSVHWKCLMISLDVMDQLDGISVRSRTFSLYGRFFSS